MRIAVVGAGVSGLSAAYRLAERHDVTLFEANDYPGGHVHTVDVEVGGERHAIDTGFIVFNDWTYPNFIALLDELGVASRPTTMGFSVQCARSGLEYNGSSLDGLFAQRSNLLRPSFWRMLRDILRFNRDAPREVLDGPANSATGSGERREELTVGQYLRRGGYSREFLEHYLLPMGSAIWSCPVGVFENFPIRFLVEFYRNHGLLNLNDRPTWRVVEGGSRTYVQALLERFRGAVRLSTPIRQVRRSAEQVEILTAAGGREEFDHVVLACHADQALRMLADPSPLERETLAEFPYEKNVALLHTDERALPRRRRAWAAWNYHLSKEPDDRATVTYCMNILQHVQSKHVFCVTLNGEERIDPARVLGRFVYEHPIFTVRRSVAQARHAELCNANRTSYCGAYWRNGFHEDGVVSALAVCRAIDGIDTISRPAGARLVGASTECG